MRLSDNQIKGIKNAFQDLTIKGELFLYGSRVDPNKRGGDIDLLFIVNSAPEKSSALEKKFAVLEKIKSLIGDQKIDLTIANVDDLSRDPFLILAASPNKRISLGSF